MTALADYTAALADESTTAERWDEINEECEDEGYRLLAAATDARRRAANFRLTTERQRAEQMVEQFVALEVR